MIYLSIISSVLAVLIMITLCIWITAYVRKRYVGTVYSKVK